MTSGVMACYEDDPPFPCTCERDAAGAQEGMTVRTKYTSAVRVETYQLGKAMGLQSYGRIQNPIYGIVARLGLSVIPCQGVNSTVFSRARGIAGMLY